MELLLLLTYTAIVATIFKVFKVPLNSFTVPTAILGAVFLLGGTLLVMNFHLPFTNVARTFVATTPIYSEVDGRIIEVPVKPNTPIKKGEVLLKINPTPFQADVDDLRAELTKAKQVLKFREEEWIEAQAEVKNKEAERNRAKDEYDRRRKANENARKKGQSPPFSEASIEQSRQTYLAAEASLKVAVSEEQGAKLKLEAIIDGTDIRIVQAQAQLTKAEYYLEETVVRAPTDGVVTQMMLRPGMMAFTHPQGPLMVFAHAEKTRIAASFPQNGLQRIQPGNYAEVIFPSIPGRVFPGKVDHVQALLAQGSIQPRGQLIELDDVSGRRVHVEIVLDTDMSQFTLPPGISAEVAVYNDDGFLSRHLSILRKMLLRMKSWTFFVFGPIK